jgi:hypothetical protein
VPEGRLRSKSQRQNAVAAWIATSPSIYVRTFHRRDAPNFSNSRMRKSSDNVRNRLLKYSRRIMDTRKTPTPFLAPSQAMMMSWPHPLGLLVRLTLPHFLIRHILISTTQILQLLLHHH